MITNRNLENMCQVANVVSINENSISRYEHLAVEIADWSSDQLDVAQRISELYNVEALHAFEVKLNEKRDHARFRHRTGLGGTCEDCGETIPLERISATQGRATRCLRCQKSYEDRRYFGR